MPRNGSGIYGPPFPPVETNHTIESAVYNGFTADIVIDLNEPRPIVAGGTGASDVAGAMDALGGETCKVQVTNYDSHDFKAGSFYSDPGAAGSPIAGHNFTGFCTPAVVSAVSTTNMFIEVRDMDDLAAPPAVYVRQKKNNTWGSWMVPATGGSNPNFSGVLTINGKPVLSSPVPNTSTNLLGLDGVPAIAVVGNANVLSINNYRGDTQNFLTRNGATTYAVMGPTNFTVSLQLDAGIMTCVAPAIADSSTRVPTTAWVRGAAADLIATTPDFPQIVVDQVGSYAFQNTEIGKHIFIASTTLATQIQISTNLTWPIGSIVMVVNYKSASMPIRAGGSITLRLAGTTSVGDRTLAPGGIATLMRVTLNGPVTEWLVWGHGVT
jgi:hypothetical protein